jgi:DNA polymerase-3 subunit gamma/tau
MDAPHYVVVARRYRPQRFTDLVGQEHVSRALTGAITSGRVGHAYLFTGARGVGKTSAARILAKALNCEKGPSPEPCNACDICQAVSGGDDVDVLEIDGASNRGIDEIRQLRQNVNVRPSRARYKIYIIDEVHMLTREAFNALLKTLEEPPEHVKFIFCTTEPEKVPITVISRCQRFDFAGIQAATIALRLRQIVDAEGISAEGEALEILARRAAGSMRDSQSLLEQLLAFGGERITAADVNRMLGTAAQGRLMTLVEHIVARNPAAALATLDAALAEGVDVGQILDQLLGYFRDLMVAAAGGSAELMLYTSPSETAAVTGAGRELGLETILAMMQVVDQALARMRVSTQRRTLAELALVRLCRLENLEELSRLLSQVTSGAPAKLAPAAPVQGATARGAPSAAEPKKKPQPLENAARVNAPALAVESQTADAATAASSEQANTEQANTGALAGEFTGETALAIWQQAVSELGDMASAAAAQCEAVAILAPNRLVVRFPAKYSVSKSLCERPQQKQRIEEALARLTGRVVRLEFALTEEPAPSNGLARLLSPRERMRQVTANPLVQRASQLFGGVPELSE